MRTIFVGVLVGVCLVLGAWAQEPNLGDFKPGEVQNPDEAPGTRKLTEAEQGLPPEKFLELARKPFLDQLWCRFTGMVEYKGDDGRKKIPVQLSLRLGAAALRAELTLQGGQSAQILQTYKPDGGMPDVQLGLSTVAPEKITLDKLGLRADDLTFCFLYWNVVKELDGERVYMQKCRVLEMEHPKTKERAQVWMLKECAFPMRVYWFRNGEQEAWRSFRFTKSFKHYGDFTFPTEMHLSGLGKQEWEAKVTFTDAEIARPSEQMEPSDLFSTVPAQPVTAPVVPAAVDTSAANIPPGIRRSPVPAKE